MIGRNRGVFEHHFVEISFAVHLLDPMTLNPGDFMSTRNEVRPCRRLFLVGREVRNNPRGPRRMPDRPASPHVERSRAVLEALV
jgi:hypothetical protein